MSVLPAASSKPPRPVSGNRPPGTGRPRRLSVSHDCGLVLASASGRAAEGPRLARRAPGQPAHRVHQPAAAAAPVRAAIPRRATGTSRGWQSRWISAPRRLHGGSGSGGGPGEGETRSALGGNRGEVAAPGWRPVACTPEAVGAARAVDPRRSRTAGPPFGQEGGPQAALRRPPRRRRPSPSSCSSRGSWTFRRSPPRSTPRTPTPRSTRR